jgi:type I restriction enzyme S subunit
MVNIAQSTILEMCVPLPPVAEQASLLSTVEQRSHEQDQLIGEAALSIALLRERRSALISAAVTGQIDVRQLV